MQDKVLVTGLGGFTGKHLERYFVEQGLKVVGLGQEPLAVDDYHCCDLNDVEGLREIFEAEKPNYVVHLAGIASPTHIPVSDFYLVNTIGTTNLLDSILASGVEPKKILVASSANVYGMAGGLISEDTPFAPVNHYGASKAAMELLLNKYNQDLPIVTVRPFNYTGVGQSSSFLVPKIVQHFRAKEKTIELGNLNIERDIQSVEQVCAAYYGLITSDIAKGVFNVCSGTTSSIQSIIEQLNELAGYQINVRVNRRYVRASDPERVVGDNNKLKSILSLPIDSSFYEVLDRMYRS
jgi:nucleoside-diphosphate-sugar epimerase